MTDNIVVITTSLSAGGAEKQAIAIANGLSEKHPVALVTLTSADFRANEIGDQVEWICLNMPSARGYLTNPILLRKSVDAMKALEPAAVLSLNFPAQAFVTTCQVFGLKTRHVISERQEDLGSRGRIFMRREMYRRAWAITANAASTASAVVEAGLAPAGSVITIPNIVDSPRQRTPPPARERFRWISIARLDAQKDIGTLLRATAALRDSGLAIELVVVGTGVDAEALHTLAEKLRLTDTVEFVGQRTDAMALLEASNALVLSSRWEGTPNVVLEASVRGVPVVATNVGGTADALPQQLREFLVPAQQPGLLADSMRHMMSLPDSDRQTLGSAMVAHIEQEFPQSQIVARWSATLLGADES